MGTQHNTPAPLASLADALFPKVRQRVLAVLFAAPQRSFFMGEVIAIAHSGTGAVQRELAGLAAAGILTVAKHGKQKHYQANTNAPIFNELRALVGKTMGVVNVLHTALDPLAGSITAGFVYDSVHAARDGSAAAVTVVLFSPTADATSAASQAIQAAANTLARPVGFTLYTPELLDSAIAHNSRFLKRLLQAPQTWLLGSEDQLFRQST